MTQPNKMILGIDIGTSGLRGCIVKRSQNSEESSILIEKSVALSMPKPNQLGEIRQNPALWREALEQLLFSLSHKVELKCLTHLVIDATSSTVLLQDHNGNVVTDAVMYNDSFSIEESTQIDQVIRRGKIQTGATGASSTLAKVLRLIKVQKYSIRQGRLIICHQADFINHYLCGALNVTDENNALKLGFDSLSFSWPGWVKKLLSEYDLTPPEVVKPGDFLGQVKSDITRKFGFSPELKVMAGTTDSIAGFLAAGATQEGEAVSSLGSTLAIKMICKSPVFNTEYGLYSHRLGDNWLVGGASNAGGRVFMNYFDLTQLNQLSDELRDNELQRIENQTYYPLLSPGERFPISDASLPPCLPDYPTCDLTLQTAVCLAEHRWFLLGLAKGLTDIEVLAFQKLSELSQTEAKHIYTVGGGSKNRAWMQLRKHLLPASVSSSEHNSAAFGVTKLI